jgi:hypothetical protein
MNMPIIAAKLRRPQTTPKLAKGPNHHKNRHFLILSPDRKIYRVDGICNFVRTNPGLFSPEDVIWKSNPPGGQWCRATGGIVRLLSKGYDYKNNRPYSRGTWKGWTLVK